MAMRHQMRESWGRFWQLLFAPDQQSGDHSLESVAASVETRMPAQKVVMPRRVRLLPAILAFAVCGIATSARANWAFTHWGMTPEEVVAASGGAAHVLPPNERTRYDELHWELSVKGHYREGPLAYQMGFMFDTETHRLKCILYNATGDDVRPLTENLIAKLGKPQKDSDFGSVRDMTWTHGDEVELAINQQPAAAVTYCAPD
jgi:hypothetical protein